MDEPIDDARRVSEDKVTWEDVKQSATAIFDVWMYGNELAWAQEVWGHLDRAGLTEASTVLEQTRSQLRLVALGRAYHEFCGLVWGENPHWPADEFTGHLAIDDLALGILAADSKLDEFEAASDDYELRNAALIAATDRLMPELFRCLKAAYGGEIKLYSRMYQTNLDNDEDEFDLSNQNAAGINYVINAFGMK